MARYTGRGFTTERQSRSFEHLAHAHHMPIDTAPRPRMAATVPACRAVVAVRRLSHKLAKTDGGHRYTCPSYEIDGDGDGRLSVPGFQPLAAYEVALANLAPDARRRPNPDDVRQVLEWAGEPLATAEVAAVCEIDLDQARQELGRVAEEEHVGFDGFWHLDGVADA